MSSSLKSDNAKAVEHPVSKGKAVDMDPHAIFSNDPFPSWIAKQSYNQLLMFGLSTAAGETSQCEKDLEVTCTAIVKDYMLNYQHLNNTGRLWPHLSWEEAISERWEDVILSFYYPTEFAERQAQMKAKAQAQAQTTAQCQSYTQQNSQGHTIRSVKNPFRTLEEQKFYNDALFCQISWRERGASREEDQAICSNIVERYMLSHRTINSTGRLWPHLSWKTAAERNFAEEALAAFYPKEFQASREQVKTQPRVYRQEISDSDGHHLHRSGGKVADEIKPRVADDDEMACHPDQASTLDQQLISRRQVKGVRNGMENDNSDMSCTPYTMHSQAQIPGGQAQEDSIEAATSEKAIPESSNPGEMALDLYINRFANAQKLVIYRSPKMDQITAEKSCRGMIESSHRTPTQLLPQSETDYNNKSQQVQTPRIMFGYQPKTIEEGGMTLEQVMKSRYTLVEEVNGVSIKIIPPKAPPALLEDGKENRSDNGSETMAGSNAENSGRGRSETQAPSEVRDDSGYISGRELLKDEGNDKLD